VSVGCGSSTGNDGDGWRGLRRVVGIGSRGPEQACMGHVFFELPVRVTHLLPCTSVVPMAIAVPLTIRGDVRAELFCYTVVPLAGVSGQICGRNMQEGFGRESLE
jgi:hypothetical protein